MNELIQIKNKNIDGAAAIYNKRQTIYLAFITQSQWDLLPEIMLTLHT